MQCTLGRRILAYGQLLRWVGFLAWSPLAALVQPIAAARAEGLSTVWAATIDFHGNVALEQNEFNGSGNRSAPFPLRQIIVTTTLPLPRAHGPRVDDQPGHATRIIVPIDARGRPGAAIGPLPRDAVCPVEMDDGRVSIVAFRDELAGWDSAGVQIVKAHRLQLRGEWRSLGIEGESARGMPAAARELAVPWQINGSGSAGVLQTGSGVYVVDVKHLQVSAIYPLPQSPRGAHLPSYVTFAAAAPEVVALSFYRLRSDQDRESVVVVGRITSTGFEELFRRSYSDGVGVVRLSKTGQTLYLGDRVGTVDWTVERIDVLNGRQLDSVPGRIVSVDDRAGTVVLATGESTLHMCELSDSGLRMLAEVEFPGINVTSPSVTVSPSARVVIDQSGGQPVLVNVAQQRYPLDFHSPRFVRGIGDEEYLLGGTECKAGASTTVRLARCPSTIR